MILITWIIVSPAVDGAPKEKITQEQIQQWIRDLGDDDFQTREKAVTHLWAAGEPAELALKKALSSKDREIVRRAKQILAKFRWGLYPDTPKAILDLIRKYRAADNRTRLQIVQQLFDEGTEGCRALLKIASFEKDESFRRQLYRAISSHAGRSFPALLADEKFDSLDALMELALQNDQTSTVTSYVAYHFLRGTLKNRIERFQTLTKATPSTDPNKIVLLYLHRAAGQMKEAIELAQKIERPDLYRDLLIEQGDWKTLSAKNLGHNSGPKFEDLGYQLAFHRLAKNSIAAQKTIDEIKSLANKESTSGGDRLQAGLNLFLNNEPEEGHLMIARSVSVSTRFDLFCAQSRYAEAFALVESDASGNERDHLELQRARIQYQLGQHEKALKTFDAFAKRITTRNNVPMFIKLLKEQMSSGLPERAFEHCAMMMKVRFDLYTHGRFLGALFDGRDQTALSVWTILRRMDPKQDLSKALAQLRDLMHGDAGEKALAAFLTEAKKTLKSSKITTSEKIKWYNAMGEVAHLNGPFSMAKEMLEESVVLNDRSAMIRLGDLFAEQKKWKEAEKLYLEAWKRDKGDPLALFLRGWALTKQGNKKEGERLQKLSHWILQAKESERAQFSKDLAERGFDEASLRECEIVIRTGKLGDFWLGDCQRQMAAHYDKQKQYAKAALHRQQALLRVLRSTVTFGGGGSYCTVAHYTKRLRAKALIQAGKLTEALSEIERLKEILPQAIMLGSEVVPVLEEKGYKKEAAKLFEQIKAKQVALCKTYPKSGHCHNNFAWMCAVAKRDLDLGLKHARLAVKYMPKYPGYRDTLAEILFQQGKQKLAIQEMKTCLKQAPARAYFLRQLARFQAGDKNAPIPEY